MSWISNKPERWLHEQQVASGLFRETSVEVGQDGCSVIYGTFYCERKYMTLGPFFIKVLYPFDFPLHDPNVYLISHETWRDLAHHIEGDGRFCWTEVKDSKIDFQNENSLKLLMENISFRLVQVEMVMRMKSKKWPGPERSHFDKGSTEAKVERKRMGIGPNTRPCICGANKKYKHCHGRKEIFVRGEQNVNSNG